MGEDNKKREWRAGGDTGRHEFAMTDEQYARIFGAKCCNGACGALCTQPREEAK